MLFRLNRTKKITGNIFVVKTLISNFFIYSDGRITICFNSGFIPLIINRELRKVNVKPESISNVFLTSPKFQHIGGIKVFKNARIYMSDDLSSKRSQKLLEDLDKRNNMEYEKIKDGDIIDLGSIKVRSFVIPGHLPGSMSYIVNDSFVFI
ncbi:glyoxylase-like metal-dependent hydrolase (beta-lactamase superfamily II) [Clostridium algifaecis]|uniref:Glyoxylase-like metal-dependent hydrolase (Beta-lactamase superfamily II) n=1 Tax=Clostridium algifaecis TaxID=1472040 RepID=A0ABS4KPB0_9CLOT|nr:MBL fold metallo-hydrolase [Clostridium algifaecis]MBP2031873.1 glyoxylase-like metal-dependent hydrolase (beta-lactamase superfamily II) [Clostridium algifaecis]